ncbi:hypothetical protein [Bacteroides oleiciplenus]|uniref:Uncharacterized protein n=1 Tax=Bacteroides oleiciplenus YIT 12058 TaxID=742727 RepID=K9DX98_9BACE|nr:hypothetical protein [Bacteroides oleiciplenus]EKU89649.1 hypothetical protein HMPREF9447_03087 [Bacteroides oleiciplenus YIT 12058]
MTNLKITTALLTVLLLLSSCSHKSETGTLFSHADAIMEEYPDSALRILNLPPEEIEELSDKECARYALLLARATDKCKLSLLPCDSLLDIALHYYGNDEKERATAFLYKGRLEAEMNSTEEAIAHLQEGLLILANLPEEVETERNILSSLGNLYFDTGYYEEAAKIYQKLYKYCYTEKDKSIALNAISSYYCVTNNEDSTITNQKKALRYAVAANDSSLIASSKFNLSLEFYQFEELDSALHYAQDAIKWLSNSPKGGNYYSHLGSLLIEKGENEDLAIHYLKSNIENSNSRASDLLSLYEVEKKRKNYEAASAYLEEHVQIVDSLVSIEQSTKVQQLIYGYKTKIKLKEEQLRGERAQKIIIISFSITCFLIILIYQNRINRKRRQQLKKDQELHQTQIELSSLQTIIDNNESIISFLQQKHIDLEEEHKIKEEQINIREQVIAKLQKEKLRLHKWLFTQSDIYKKVDSLFNQKVADKKDIKVLTNAEQRKLKDTVLNIYTEYADTLHQKYSKLTEDDIVLLCLQEAQLAPKAIAICFGYSDTHTINQRKLRIKQRMNEL